MGVLLAGSPVAKPKLGGLDYNALLDGAKVWAEEPTTPTIPVGSLAFLINSGADSSYIIPKSGGATASYNWVIDWGDGSPAQTVSGTSMNDPAINPISHAYPAANTDYNLVITCAIDPAPNGWARAYGQSTFYQQAGSQTAANRAKLRQILSLPKARAFFGLGGISVYGVNFCANMFLNCVNLTNAWPEDCEGAEGVVNIDSYFRQAQYKGCTSLTAPAEEVMPPNATRLDFYFRQEQYAGCSSLAYAAPEVLPSTLIQVGQYFRFSQYLSSGIAGPATEYLPNGLQLIGFFFRFNQYGNCKSPTFQTPAAEVIPSSVTSISFGFRGGQYNGCTSLIRATPEVLPPAVELDPGNFRTSMYAGCSSLVESTPEVMVQNLSPSQTISAFRSGQWQGTAITEAPLEQFPAGWNMIGNDFRSTQYQNCTKLIAAAAEVPLTGVVWIGDNFRASQYAGCNSLMYPAAEAEWPATAPYNRDPHLAQPAGDWVKTYRNNQYAGCPFLIANYVFQSRFPDLINLQYWDPYGWDENTQDATGAMCDTFNYAGIFAGYAPDADTTPKYYADAAHQQSMNATDIWLFRNRRCFQARYGLVDPMYGPYEYIPLPWTDGDMNIPDWP